MTLISFEGQAPQIDAEAGYLAYNATLIGRVRIGAGASVWFGAVLRGDNEWIEIGAGSNVQDNCVLHTDPGYPLVVEPDCTLGHGACVHGGSIGRGSLVGMGATVLNGARIGRNCLIGAKALVPEGAQIPDGSLVLGVPGKVVRTLDPEAIVRLAESARIYRDKSERYKASAVVVS